MRNRWRLRAVCLGHLLLLVIANIGTFFVPQRLSAEPAPRQHSRDEMVQKQKARTAAIRAAVVSESFDEVVAHLRDNDAYEFPGYWTQRANDQDDFGQILSSRRTLKLVALLQKLSKAEARDRCLAICDLIHRESERTIRVVIDSYTIPGVPKNTQALDSNKLGFGAALFALAHFGEPTDIIDQLMRQDCLRRMYEEQIQRHQALFPEHFELFVKRWVCLDAACKINLLAYCVNRSASTTPATREEVSRILARLERRTWRIASWDAETTFFDTTHKLAHLPIDASKGVSRLDVYSFEMVSDIKSHERVVEDLITICRRNSTRKNDPK